MITYIERPVTRRGLEDLSACLWQPGREELRLLGYSEWKMVESFLRFAATGSDSGILYADGAPLMAAGIAPEEGGSFTWMQASTAFGKHRLACLRTLRRRIRQHRGPLYIYSVLPHAATDRFYRALGFVPDAWRGATATGNTLYRYRR